MNAMNETTTTFYKDLLNLLQKNSLESEYALFKTHLAFEPRKENPVLFVGRDTNGLAKTETEKKNLLSCYDCEELTWLVDGYKYQGSPFWRVIGKTTCETSGEEYGYDIFKRVHWSNLFKVCKQEKCKTPDDIKDLQREKCAQLLVEEIFDIRPEAVIFLTGPEIDPFLKLWTKDQVISEVTEFQGAFIKTFTFERDGKKIRAIAVHHPQGKQEGEIISHCSGFLKGSEHFKKMMQRSQMITHRMQKLKEMLNREGDGGWWLYGTNDLGYNDLKIGGHVIGIESAFWGDPAGDELTYRYCFTTWSAEGIKYMERHFKDAAVDKFGNKIIGEVQKRCSWRADIPFKLVKLEGVNVTGEQDTVDKENEDVVKRLLQAKAFLLDMAGK